MDILWIDRWIDSWIYFVEKLGIGNTSRFIVLIFYNRNKIIEYQFPRDFV